MKQRIDTAPVNTRRRLRVRRTARQALITLLALITGLASPTATFATSVITSSPGRDLVMPFSQLGQREAVTLKRGHSRHRLPFALRADEVVSSAVLKLDIAHSPMLAGRAGALEVKLNGEVVARLDAPAAAGTRSFSHTVTIDPRLVLDRNELGLQFAEPVRCDDPDGGGLWAQISPTSALELLMAPLPLADDLSRLPSPFFDPNDPRRNELTLVFSPQAAEATLQAAGSVASWFGALSAWRGVRIQARDRLPAGHAIVLATPDDVPAGVGLPPIAGATITLAPHPDDPQRKVLYLLGRNGDELRRAADALVRGELPGQGSTALIDPLAEPAPRRAWDAPNWTPTHRPVRLDELVPVHTLVSHDAQPIDLDVRMRLPPDLFAWRQRQIPIDLRLRHESRPGDAPATLKVRFNGDTVREESLVPGDTGRWLDGLQRRLRGERDDTLTHSAQRTLRVPVAALGTQSYTRLDLKFQHSVGDEVSECLRESRSDAALDHPRSVVDGASTLDFSTAPHFLPMPNLAAFANAGHPYTRLGDLAETAVVLPDQPSREDLDTFLTLMGRAGEATGLPARNVQVVRTRGVARVADLDLIVIGSAGNQRLFADWAADMPFRDLAARTTTEGRPDTGGTVLPDWRRWLGMLWQRDQLPPLDTLTFRGTDAQAALVGFESPLSSGRSVVGLMATTPAALSFLTDALLDSARLAQIHGHVTLFDETGRITAYKADPTYGSGDLPWLSWLRWQLSSRPVLLWVVLLLSILALSSVIYVLLQRHALRRHAGAST